MREYKLFTQQNVPCWSRLEWQHSAASIRFLVHQNLIPMIDSLPDDHHWIQHYSMQGYGTFHCTPEAWGFNGSLKRTPKTEDDFFGFDAKLPLVRKNRPDPCRTCDGSGKNEDLGRACLHCDGTSKETYYDWKEIHSLSASLSLLSTLINQLPPEQDMPSTQWQLLTFTMHARPQSFPLCGEYSPKLIDWFRQLGVCSLTEAQHAMYEAWKIMEHELHDFDKHQIFANIDYANGWLNIGCPGDACGLHPSDSNGRMIGGYEFTCHNMDHPIQQFTLLAGLARIEMMAREALET